jgi:hypothetical protein
MQSARGRDTGREAIVMESGTAYYREERQQVKRDDKTFEAIEVLFSCYFRRLKLRNNFVTVPTPTFLNSFLRQTTSDNLIPK